MWGDYDWAFGTKNDKEIRELLYPILMSLAILLLRYILERFLFRPLGIRLGVTDREYKKAPINAILDHAYSVAKKWKRDEIEGFAKQTNMSENEVEEWLRLKIAENMRSDLSKFSESSWKFFYYTCVTIGGVAILWNKPWLWDVNECWSDYDHQIVTNDVWWHFMISFAFMWSLLIGLHFDVRRKDFYMMFLHHVAAIIFMSLSWRANFFRIYSLGLVVHDCCDILLEGGKLLLYLNLQKSANALFVIFTLVWIITRLGIFPFVLIRTVVVDVPILLPTFPTYPAYYVYVGFMCLFVILDLIWTYFILKMAYSLLVTGQLGTDARSDKED